ncbi:maleylpyruvate isomerase family mycothiol-dependent enzyme [Dactylosporangium sp. CA-139066]|uniref:maleylpyruvate isomerase family mycothiol-dependent enzyme n=1 Tax=Dactylosporangium sp. CA-139066 TaxID=3239930 RepID=UPI003D8ED55F
MIFWPVIDQQRTAVADLLETLTPDEWRRPSLCAQWTVREVAAHLTLQQLRPRDLLTALPVLLRARGDIDRLTHDLAAGTSDAELLRRLRATIGSRRHNAGVTPMETLTDILVHGQDIAIPLGRDLAVPPGAAAAAATRNWTMRWPPPFPIKKTLRRYSLSATDTDWRAGDAAGPAVEGPMSALLLLTCGRLVALDRLSGPGAEALRAALGDAQAASTSTTDTEPPPRLGS